MWTPDLDCSTLQMENQCQFYGPLELSPSLAPNIRAQATYVVTTIISINFIFDSFSSMSHDPAFPLYWLCWHLQPFQLCETMQHSVLNWAVYQRLSRLLETEI